MNEWMVPSFKILPLKSDGQTDTMGEQGVKINEDLHKYLEENGEQYRQRWGNGSWMIEVVFFDGLVFEILEHGRLTWSSLW